MIGHREAYELTPRERQLVQLLANGMTANQIAIELHLAPGTVKSHLKLARHRLNALNSVHLAVIALRRGDVT